MGAIAPVEIGDRVKNVFLMIQVLQESLTIRLAVHLLVDLSVKKGFIYIFKYFDYSNN